MDRTTRRLGRRGHDARTSHTYRPRIGRVATALLLLIGLSLPSVAHADDVPQPQARIVGGTTATATDVSASGRWSAVVAIYATDDRGTRLCTGTLIAANWVATAAHCVATQNNASVPLPASSMLVAANVTAAPYANSSVYSVVSTRIHPAFSWANAQWDAALIELASTVPTTPFALPDALRPNSYGAGTAENVAGFGRLQATSAATSGTLHTGRLEQVDAGSCETYNPGSSAYADCYLPGSARQATCFGDSGGPLVRFDTTQGNQPVLWGITSTGPDPCDASLSGQFAPSYATRTLAIADWLRASIAGSTYIPKNSAPRATPAAPAATSDNNAEPDASPRSSIRTLRAKLARKPSRKHRGSVTVSSSINGALTTGKTEVRRCVRKRCKTTARKTVKYAGASKRVTSKLKVPRCTRHATISVRLRAYDESGKLKDQATRRLARCH